MTIRKRLTLWYAVIMFVSLAAMGSLAYHEFAPDPTPDHGEGDDSDLGQVLSILFWCGVPPALIALAGGWWLMRRSLAPVADLTGAMEKIHEKNLGEKIPRSGNGDELDRLTEVFNAMTARLDDGFRHIREFTLHASHELKTPLTVLHGEIETDLNVENLSAPQREKLASQLDEIQRLAKIVDGLTLLTKADAGQVALKFEPLALDEIVREVFEDTQILARPGNISVGLAVCEPVETSGDRHRLRQLLLNLADNAVKYNQPDGRIEISLRRIGEMGELKISNTGAGIPPEILPLVFDRFFRGGAAHSSTTDGCGLGLSIARWITTAHRGEIHLTSTPEKMTEATVKLPAC